MSTGIYWAGIAMIITAFGMVFLFPTWDRADQWLGIAAVGGAVCVACGVMTGVRRE